MRKNLIGLNFLFVFFFTTAFSQRTETVYLNASDTTNNMYIAVLPEGKPITAFLFLMDGFGVSPRDVLVQTKLPMAAAQTGILTIIPILFTGPRYFGVDKGSQQSLKSMIEKVASKYQLEGMPLYLGGFSAGGGCVVKYAELAVKENYPIKPKAIFAVDPPLDWMRFYNSAKRMTRLSAPGQANGELTYMIGRIERELGGTPAAVPQNYYNLSPYSYADTTQRAIKYLTHTPVMLISEPDIQWWLVNHGFDYTGLNIVDHGAMINELQRLGNKKAVLVTTTDKGYREPGHIRLPHSWSIAEPTAVLQWLLTQ